MRRIAQVIRIKRDRLSEYKRMHTEVWPEVLQQIKECNIVDYSIFLDEPRLTLVATMKYTGSDFEGDMARMRANPKVQEWWDLMDPMQESLRDGATGSKGGRWWQELEEVFYLE